MPDLIFTNSRLVSIYDQFDGQRNDLTHYLNIARELSARSVIDIGCGTGCFAQMLCKSNFEVTGLDPALTSLKFAQKKTYGDQIRWIHGEAKDLPSRKYDLATMTGNVAQVFVTDEEWKETLHNTHRSLKSNGHFVFESRNPSKKAWQEWTPQNTVQTLELKDVGKVTGWCEVTHIEHNLVHFCWTYKFASDGETLVSKSTLRFRERDEIEDSLLTSGFTVQDIREAPDRPGKEFVFIASVN